MSTYAKSLDFLFNQMRNGSVGDLAAGSITCYASGSTTPKAVWTNREKTTPSVGGITTPYTLTADGTATLFGDGLYKFVVKDSTGVTIYTYDQVEVIADDPAASATSYAELLFDGLTGIDLKTLADGVDDVIIMRTDAGTYACTLTLPTGFTFVDGAATYSLYIKGEAAHFILPATGTIYYKVA